MRYNRHIYSIVAALAAFVQVASAQNLDPTVEVNRAYEGKLMEVHKPLLDMAVPDSVMQFDLTFDYSVFESPYRGSYEFNPYLLSMKPSGTEDESRKFYLRAGAGYQLHPQLDMVWSPKLGKGFRLDVYALHRSYVGNYWKITGQDQADGTMLLGRLPESASERTWKGNDLMTRAGFDAHHDWKKGVFSFGAEYVNMTGKDLSRSRSYNAVDVYAGLGNKGEWEQSFLYDFRVDYRYGGDKEDSYLGKETLIEHVASFKGSLGPVFREKHRVLFDFGVDLAVNRSAYEVVGGQVHFTPHYVFEKGPMMLDLGLRFSMLVRDTTANSFYSKKGQLIYPSMKFHLALIPDAMRFYVHAGGGNRLNTFSSIMESNHHMNLHSASWSSGPLMDYTVERVSLAGGFEGRISSRFSYNLKAGYVNYANELSDMITLTSSDAMTAGIFYEAYRKWYAGLDWCLDVEGFRFDGAVVYNRVWGDSIKDSAFLKPAALMGDVAAEYNWKRRIFVGADCEFRTARKGNVMEALPGGSPDIVPAVLPGYADLGIYAEYVTSRGLAFWIRGGNLLNMTIQRNPVYAEKGPYITLGICLNL